MTVSIVCEECGKIYHIAQDRLSKLKGKTARIKCKDCGYLMTLKKPEPEPAKPESLEAEATSPAEVPDEQYEKTVVLAPPPAEEQDRPGRVKKLKNPGLSIKGLGLRGNMTTLFLIIPIALMAICGLFMQKQLHSLSASLTGESTKMVTQMAENLIAESGRSVADQCRLYLSSHPELKQENFYEDATLKQLAVQKVGMTGFTSLYSVAQDEKPMTLWMHPDPKFVGSPLNTVMRTILKGEFNRFEKIVGPAEKGKNIEHSGYYLWPDPKGQFREKFVYNVPIEGTNFGISTETYLDELMIPVKQLEVHSAKMTRNTRNINFGILIGTLAIIGVIVSLYGHRLIYNIKHLTDIADRISVGELDAEIQIESGDEIGRLAEAISRMQDSLRLSIERLRRRF